MSASSDSPLGPGGAKIVDDEHRIQVELIEALEASVESNRGAGEVEEVLSRFMADR